MPALPPPLHSGLPLNALAPMQDVTTLPFMRLIAGYGPPDYYFTEYFRVYEHSRLEPHILASVTENATGRPVFAQLIGEHPDYLERAARQLEEFPVAGIDLNLGCPAPKIYRKNVGGGLLRDLDQVDAIFTRLRAVVHGPFTVKTRLGFDSFEPFEALLELVNKHRIDLLSVHARTVKEMYRGEAHHEYVKFAAGRVRCPVLANGNITSAEKARQILNMTGAAGIMAGRSAIRNPWLFRQIRELLAGETPFQPTLGDLRDYIERLWQATSAAGMTPVRHVARMKKFLNFIGQGVDADGGFLYDMRRTRTPVELFSVCDRYLVEAGKADALYADEPYSGLVARPTRE